jgi:hypothetical protein
VNLPRQFVKIRQITFLPNFGKWRNNSPNVSLQFVDPDANHFAPILRYWLVKIAFGLNENALQ